MMINLSVIWNVNPTAFSFGNFEIRWYGILFAVGFMVAWYILSDMLKKEKKSPKLADSLFFYSIVGAIIGLRLGHCFFYNPSYYLANPIEILYIRDGGLASHGGAIALLVAFWLVARKYKESYLYILDRAVILIPMVGALVRIGNLFNSEIYGEPTSLPWGFIFVRNGEILPHHPTQIYEALSYILLAIGLYIYYIRKDRKPINGTIFGWFLIVLFGMRFLIEYIKLPQEAWEQNYMLNMGQMLSIPFIILGAGLLLRVKKQFKA